MKLFSRFRETGGLRSVSYSVPNLVFVVDSYDFVSFLFFCFVLFGFFVRKS